MKVRITQQYRDYTGLSCERFYRILDKRMRYMSGYQMFGFDWITLRSTRPQLAWYMQDCIACDPACVEPAVQESQNGHWINGQVHTPTL